jgi:CDP-glycerol glycerophosphotransferase
VVPAFDTGAGGLTLTARVPVVVAHDLTLVGRRLSGTLVSAVELVAARTVAGAIEGPLRLSRLDADARGPRYAVSGEVPTDRPVVEPGAEVPLSITRTFVAVAADGTLHEVTTDLDDAAPEVFAGTTLTVASSPGGAVVVLDAPGRVLVDGWVLEPGATPRVRLHGRYVVDPVGDASVPRLDFVGNRQVLPLDLETVPGAAGQGAWSGSVPLHVPEWGRQPLPPRQGVYVLRASLSDATVVPVTAVPEVSAGTPRVEPLDGFRLVLQSGGGRSVRLKVSPPRRPDELGSFHQRRLERSYLGRPHAVADAVYFESFYGRGATCNPRAIDAEVARTRPDLTRYWGVVDAATPVPEGAVAVVRGTREWWEARAGARWVVANDWLRRQFEPQHDQVVLQTWHGSMLKRIGLDRPKVPAEKRRVIDVERAKWDLLLSQNRHSTDILRSAYAWEGPILEEGYPRNDPLTPGSTQAGDGAAIRAALGIGPSQRAVLYAPTWRENMTTMVTFLDLERLAASLGPDHVILLRGHSRTVAFGASVKMRGVIDVTTYPEVTDLFLAADALITDYSSVMFDYSVTRRPMIFYVPDMDAYRDSLRGVYFDLSEVAPGPVLDDQDDVADAVRALDQAGDRYAALYERWVGRFNHHDDGRSAERVTEQLLAFEK